MKILVTGAAGFIGYHVCHNCLINGHDVVGLDNINDYYNVELKYDRLTQLGIEQKNVESFGTIATSSIYDNFKFIRLNLEDKDALPGLFENEQFDIVCNLAAQAGVRYSLEHPEAYIDSNIVGFLNILECSKKYTIKHLVYASSSSVYGMNEKIPFETSDNVDNPISLYAATKKSNELMAYTYSHLYNIPTTGLRFFTVYGPWGRPDMALFLFTQAIMQNKPIKVFNDGNLERDFTYIEDVNNVILEILQKKPREKDLYKIYNVGNNKSVKLLDFIEAIEENLGAKAQKILMPMQPGDVKKTWANVDDLVKDYGYRPNTDITEGVKKFVDWYKNHYFMNQ
ncbi:NAD-dependent epimerase [Costertonia aggregata]|uniref:NAD-dependent epimerase n=1 Tax=Costertonia aggregata TaxID=343403 RepID=A0A7H9ATH8_9FLAO|nr:NAD-dependent epimerase [Costertonia aggregata]QLG46707.1 NAD-dependent epimerase [Costertonia aggregata]